MRLLNLKNLIELLLLGPTGEQAWHTPLLSLWSLLAWWIHSCNTQTHGLDEDALPGWLCSGMTDSFWNHKASKGDAGNFQPFQTLFLSLLHNSKMGTMGVAPDLFRLLNPPVGLTPTRHLHLPGVEHSNIQLYLLTQLGLWDRECQNSSSPTGFLLKGFHSSTPSFLNNAFSENTQERKSGYKYEQLK